MLDKMKLKLRMKLSSLWNWKVKLALVGIVLLIAGIGFYKVNQFFDKHTFVWESPITVQTPVYLIDRAQAEEIIIKQIQSDSLPLNANERYLCQVFGQECKNALMIQHLENGTEQCDRFHINSNGTIDVGFMQINSIHLKKGYTLTDLADCHKNIEIAYQIYKDSGWGAWTTAKQLGIK
jgi:hypothetical protein